MTTTQIAHAISQRFVVFPEALDAHAIMALETAAPIPIVPRKAWCNSMM